MAHGRGSPRLVGPTGRQAAPAPATIYGQQFGSFPKVLAMYCGCCPAILLALFLVSLVDVWETARAAVEYHPPLLRVVAMCCLAFVFSLLGEYCLVVECQARHQTC
jgi:hypothetical protein